MIKDISDKLKAAYENGSRRCLRTIYCAYPSFKDPEKIKYVLALLNSSLFWFYYPSNFYCSQMSPREGNFRFRKQFISRLPIKAPESVKDKREKQIVGLREKMHDLKDQKGWITSSFDIAIKNFNLTRNKPLKYFLDPETSSKYKIKLTKTERMDAEERGIPKEYEVRMEGQKVLVMVRTANEVNFRRGVALSFANSVLRDYFYLALKRYEGKKTYRTDKKILDTLLEDMVIPQYEDSKLINENVAQIEDFMNALSREHKETAKEQWDNSPIQELNLARIEEEIETTEKSINEKVYNLYGLDDEEIETIESYIKKYS